MGERLVFATREDREEGYQTQADNRSSGFYRGFPFRIFAREPDWSGPEETGLPPEFENTGITTWNGAYLELDYVPFPLAWTARRYRVPVDGGDCSFFLAADPEISRPEINLGPLEESEIIGPFTDIQKERDLVLSNTRVLYAIDEQSYFSPANGENFVWSRYFFIRIWLAHVFYHDNKFHIPFDATLALMGHLESWGDSGLSTLLQFGYDPLAPGNPTGDPADTFINLQLPGLTIPMSGPGNRATSFYGTLSESLDFSDITLEQNKYFQFAAKDGSPIYDEDTGERLQDPTS